MVVRSLNVKSTDFCKSNLFKEPDPLKINTHPLLYLHTSSLKPPSSDLFSAWMRGKQKLHLHQSLGLKHMATTLTEKKITSLAFSYCRNVI